MASCTILIKASSCGLNTGMPMRRRHKLHKPRACKSWLLSTPILLDITLYINHLCHLTVLFLRNINKDHSTTPPGAGLKFRNIHHLQHTTVVQQRQSTTATTGPMHRWLTHTHELHGESPQRCPTCRKGPKCHPTIHHSTAKDTTKPPTGLTMEHTVDVHRVSSHQTITWPMPVTICSPWLVEAAFHGRYGVAKVYTLHSPLFYQDSSLQRKRVLSILRVYTIWCELGD